MTKPSPRSPITLRLDPATQDQYELEAAALNMSLSAYLRDRLERSDLLAREVAMLRQEVTGLVAAKTGKAPEAAPKHSGGGGDMAARGMQVEAVLLLRALMLATNRSQDVKMVHAELDRQGLPLWSGKK